MRGPPTNRTILAWTCILSLALAHRSAAIPAKDRVKDDFLRSDAGLVPIR